MKPAHAKADRPEASAEPASVSAERARPSAEPYAAAGAASSPRIPLRMRIARWPASCPTGSAE